MTVTDDMTRVRQLFDEAMAETFDALFEAPDAVAVVSAVAQGDLAIVITGDTLRVVSVVSDEAAQPQPDREVFGTGLYL